MCSSFLLPLCRTGGRAERVCDTCIPARHRAEKALAVMLAWWSESALTRLTAGMSAGKLKLWLQLAEQCDLNGPAASRAMKDMLHSVSRIVLSDALAVVKGTKRYDDVSWRGVMQRCPKMARKILCDSDAFREACTSSLHGEKADSTSRSCVVAGVRLAGDAVLFTEWMVTVMKGICSGPVPVSEDVLDAVVRQLVELGENAKRVDWAASTLLRAAEVGSETAAKDANTIQAEFAVVSASEWVRMSPGHDLRDAYRNHLQYGIGFLLTSGCGVSEAKTAGACFVKGSAALWSMLTFGVYHCGFPSDLATDHDSC